MKALFFSKTINIFNKIEFLVIIIIAYSRFNLFQLVKEVEDSDFIVCFGDVEDGWSFILLTILFILNVILLFKEKSSIFWCLKLIIFLSLFMIISSFYWFAYTLLLILIMFYAINPVSKEFNVYGKNKTGYIFIVVIGTFVSLFIESIVDLTYYF